LERFDKSEWDFNKSNEDFKTVSDNSPQAVNPIPFENKVRKAIPAAAKEDFP
jgi:hypothetical protein